MQKLFGKLLGHLKYEKQCYVDFYYFKLSTDSLTRNSYYNAHILIFKILFLGN